MHDKKNWTEQKINFFSYSHQGMEALGQICILTSWKVILEPDKKSRLLIDRLWLCTLGIYKWYFWKPGLSVVESESDNLVMGAGLGTWPYGQPVISPYAKGKDWFGGIYEERNKLLNLI